MAWFRLFKEPEVPPLTAPPPWMVVELQRRTGQTVPECERILTAPSLEEYWAITGDGPSDEEDNDPIESNLTLAPYLLRATLEAERLAGREDEEGSCHSTWDRKKRILRRRYGVRWRDPSESNPAVFYD